MKYTKRSESWEQIVKEKGLDSALKMINKQIAINLIHAHNQLANFVIDESENTDEYVCCVFENTKPEYEKIVPEFVRLRELLLELMIAGSEIHSEEAKKELLGDYETLEMKCELVFRIMDDEHIYSAMCETLVEDVEQLRHIFEQIYNGFIEKGEEVYPLRVIYDDVTAIYGDIIEYMETMQHEAESIYSLRLFMDQEDKEVFCYDEEDAGEDQPWLEAYKSVKELLKREIYFLGIVEHILDEDIDERYYYVPSNNMHCPLVPSFSRKTDINTLKMDYTALNCNADDPAYQKVIQVLEQATLLFPDLDKNVNAIAKSAK